jgi:hypothetical protein
LRVLDALANLDFLMRLQQFALADVLQVHADEVDVVSRHASLERLPFFVFIRLGLGERLEIVAPADGLIRKRLRLFLFEESARLNAVVRLTFLGVFPFVNGETVILSAVMPVQNLGLACRAPLNQRAAFATRLEGKRGRMRGFPGHDVWNCKGAAFRYLWPAGLIHGRDSG